MSIGVRFMFMTGIRQPVFSNVRLSGSWDGGGIFSNTWSNVPMQAVTGVDGCPAFEATVNLDVTQVGTTFNWGVTLDGPAGPNVWGIPTELGDPNSTARYRSFVLSGAAATQEVDYYLTYTRALGARKYYGAAGAVGAAPGISFSVWAPYAQTIQVVFGLPGNGYIDNNGGGIDATAPVIPLTKGANDIWSSDPALYAFAGLEGKPYMYRIVNEQGETTYRTDLYSLYQSGTGATDPNGAAYAGSPGGLDGTVSCSVVVDPDVVLVPGTAAPVADTDFWASEFSHSNPVPTQLEDLVIYELHVPSLGYGNPGPGTLADAMTFLDHLTTLGVNAVELMPLAQYDGDVGWGYGDSHHFAIQSSVEGRDEYRLFVRTCHQKGIAVIQDVVYNHYDDDGTERAESYFDSTLDNHNIYYWYEGVPADYADPQYGYVDNGSTGYTPRFWDEHVRAMFISSAAAYVMDLHVDGFRVDLTDAIHQNNTLHKNNVLKLSPDFVQNANAFGCKFLREWSRTLRLLKPTVMLAAEDYTAWPAMTQLPDNGGMGFDSIWYADFLHHLQGDGNYQSNYARLIYNAGFGGNGPLQMDYFGGALQGSGDNKIVYHENHDESGNEGYNDPTYGCEYQTHRTMVIAVNCVPIIGPTRAYAEARCRFAIGMNILSAGTPMFFMGEEIGAQNDFLYVEGTILASREDIIGQSAGDGAQLFRLYQDIIHFRLAHPAVRTHTLSLVYTNNNDRVLAFLRTEPTEELLVIASLSNTPFSNGYVIQSGALPDGNWREIFNSDAAIYGGNGVGNFGASVPSSGGQIQVIIPANGFLIFSKS